MPTSPTTTAKPSKPFAHLTPFAIVPAAAMRVLRPGLLATFMAVASFASAPDQDLDLTHAQIADRRDRSPHTVRKQLYALEDLGILSIETVYRDGGAVCARYRIQYARLLELAGMEDEEAAATGPRDDGQLGAGGEESPDPPQEGADEQRPADDARLSGGAGASIALAERIEVLARAWHETAGLELDLGRELLLGEHAIRLEVQQGNRREFVYFTAADYIVFALKRQGAFTDIRRRWVTRAVRRYAATLGGTDAPAV